MLLVVVVVVLAAMAEAVSLNPSLRHASGFQTVPIYIHPPENIQSSQPLDYKHILYSYSLAPTEYNIRHRGQNPVRYSVASSIPQAAPYIQRQSSGFDRGHIEFPGQTPHRAQFVSPFYYARPPQQEEDLDHIPLRDAVESVPVEAQEYISRVVEDEVPFSRSNVESYPHFQTPYSGGVRDDEMQAVVVEVSDGGLYEDDEKFGWVGIRDSVESPPLRTPIQDPEEASPLPVQLNSRPYGMWSEELLGLSEVSFDPELDEDNIRPHSDTSLGYKAGGELANYKATIRSQSGDYKLICYFGGWSVYRPEPFDFSVTDIDPFSCTHIIYSFAGLKKDEHTIISLDEKLDIIQGSYKAAVGLKEQNPALKVMIAIGGWNEGGKKYSRMASSKLNREKFITSVIAFIKEHGFDGLDLDWEYPGASDRGGSWSDNKNFADLVDELAVAFKPYGWLLSAAVSPARFRVNEGYDVTRLAKSLDFINIMTYDLRGPWDGKADHHAPISTRTSDTWSFKNLNTKDGMAYWALKGAPKEKLVMGIPFYGRSFTLADTNKKMPGARAQTSGKEGQYTKERGFLAYYEVCQLQQQNRWDLERDSTGAPYMSMDDQWVGYDDKDYITKKMDLIKSEGFAGAMVWAIDLDDYKGVCGERWPLLSAIRRNLGLKAVPSATIPLLPLPSTTTTTTTSTTTEVTTERTTLRPEESELPGSSKLSTPRPTDISMPCSLGENFIADPHSCSHYLVCIHGEWKRQKCQANTLWNPEQRVCDWPANVKCKNKPTPPPTGSKWPKPETSTPPQAHPGFPGQEPPAPPERPEGYPKPDEIHKPSPIDLTPVDATGGLSGDYMVVCYFTNWAWYRPGLGKYKPEDIDPSICTHIVYGFAVLDYSNLVMKPHDSWADIDNKFYQKVTDLKRRGIKVTVAIGGWNDSAGDKYSRLVNNPTARRKFIQHVIEFIQKYNFDGLDLDWEYPVCWQVDCNKGPASDKEAFATWVKELSEAFKPHGLLLSAAVSPSKKVIDAGYDVPTLSNYMDWIAVMTYDFHGHWDKKTGHVAPMYYHPEDDYDYFNMDFAIRYWLEKGASKDKIVLGMPLYGQSFTLNDPKNTGLNSPARSGGQAGEFTRARGFLAYYEICKNIQQGWQVVKDPEGRMGPYAYSGNQWVSFDDVDTIRMKSEYIRKMGLAGGMVWALDLDDFSNRCGQGRHPLMNTIKAVLGPSKSGVQPPQLHPPAPETMPSKPSKPDNLPVKPVTTDRPWSQGTTPSVSVPEHVITPKPGTSGPVYPKPDGDDGYKVVCYFTNWAWYRPGEGKYVPEDIDSSLCTHIIYGFAVLDTNTKKIKAHDSWADYDNKFYERVVAHKAKGVKVLVAIGGWNDSAGSKYSVLVNNRATRNAFNEHVVEFILKYNFDGLDLDWEYPVCWQVSCDKGPNTDKTAFADWVRELKQAFQPHGLLLSSAVSPSNKVIDMGYDVPVLSQYLDWIAVMTYDYHGQWDKKTGHVSPMYAHPEDDNLAFNTNFTIHYWIKKGADRKKLVMGMPMYGQSFSLAERGNKGLNQPTYGGGEAGQYTRARGFLAYYEICYRIQNRGWTVVRDPQGRMGPYAYKGDQWVGFDDVAMIRYKSEYIKTMGLGGGMIWALDLDDFKNRCGCEHHPLLKTINRVLRNYPEPDPNCPLLGGLGEMQPLVSTGSVVRVPETPDIHPPVQPDEPPPPPRSTTMGSCQSNALSPHPTDCAKYMECVHGELVERKCAGGLVWVKDRCDWKSKGCRVGQAPQVGSPVTVGTPLWHTTTTTAATTTRTTTTTTTTTTTMATWQKPIVPSPSTPSVARPPVVPHSGYMVVCYFTNWAWYRRGPAKYMPKDIDPNLCTHIVYGFAVLDATKLVIRPHDSWADIDNKFYEKVVALKARGIKVTLAIGGWNDSAGDKYSRLVNNPAARRKFNEHVIQFILKYNFDGLDLDWEYPVCWQVNCEKGNPADKAAFAEWVKELHEAFRPHGLLLSAAVSPSYKVIDAGYDVPKLNRYFDWIAVMTYDYHGHWDKKTGHVSPMYYHPDDDEPLFNTNSTIHYWIEKGADRKKLVMGMPLYGQAFSLGWNSKGHGLNEPAPDKGQAGEYTRAAGFLAYYEICHRIQSKGYTLVKDPQGTMGPYAYKGKQWVSFDDTAMIRHKSEYIKMMGLGGGMVWALDLDDFRGRCGCENHPLLRTINRVLRSYPEPEPTPRCDM